MNTIQIFLAAYRQAKETERKRKDYMRLVGSELSYTILRELINTAQHGVAVYVTLKSGEKLEIRREDPLEAYRKNDTGEYF